MKAPASVVLYAACTQLTADHQPIETGLGRLYIRAYTSRGRNVSEALSHADPLPGEIVLNTVPHPGTQPHGYGR